VAKQVEEDSGSGAITWFAAGEGGGFEELAELVGFVESSSPGIEGRVLAHKRTESGDGGDILKGVAEGMNDFALEKVLGSELGARQIVCEAESLLVRLWTGTNSGAGENELDGDRGLGEVLPEAAHQAGDFDTLRTAVGVSFVENDEFKAVLFEDFGIAGPEEQVLHHSKIG